MTTPTETTTAPAGSIRPLPVASMQDLVLAGEKLAQANFMGAKSSGQGFLLAATAYQQRMSFVQLAAKYHYQQNTLSVQAHAILSELVQRGGSYKIIAREPNRAAIQLTKDGNTYLSDLTWEAALKETFVYAGKESDALAELLKPVDKRRLKPKYQTPWSRKQMLWARAVSDGVVTVDPGARGGLYTPEEVEDFAPSAPGEEAAPVEDAAPTAAPVEDHLDNAIAAAVEDPSPSTIAAAVQAIQDTHAPAAAEVNAAVCPIPGRLQGKRWTDLPTEALQYTVEFPEDCPGVTQSHLAVIRQTLEERRIMGEGNHG